MGGGPAALRFVTRVLAFSRYFILIAILGSFIASAAAMTYGGVATASIVLDTFRSPEFSVQGAKYLSVGLITMIDLFLLGTVMYIVAIGLYELFIAPANQMPAWLRIHTLDDLKERLLGVVVVLLAVTFLASAVTWDGSTSILALGLAIAAVLGVVTMTIAILARTHRADGPRVSNDERATQTNRDRRDSADQAVATATDALTPPS
jgi:uncharacterized membrane protein YqhA